MSLSGGGWLGPRDDWPEHPRPLARASLTAARSAGWWLKKGRNHVFGLITCGDPSTVPQDARCRTSIFSTSGSHDGSDTARVIDEYIQKCPHARPSVASGGALETAEGLVGSAEAAIEMVVALQAAHAHRELMEDFLAQSANDLEAAEVLLAQALDEEYAADEMDVRAAQAAGRAGMSADLGTDDIVGKAEGMLAEANTLIVDDRTRAARLLRARVDKVRTDLQVLRADLGRS